MVILYKSDEGAVALRPDFNIISYRIMFGCYHHFGRTELLFVFVIRDN